MGSCLLQVGAIMQQGAPEEQLEEVQALKAAQQLLAAEAGAAAAQHSEPPCSVSAPPQDKVHSRAGLIG